MTIKLCVIMDPIEKITIKKDTTFALMLEAQKRQWEISYVEPQNIFMKNAEVFGLISKIHVEDTLQDYFRFLDPNPQKIPLSHFDVILVRPDPPFDLAYLYLTYLLDIAQKSGCLVVNNPQSIRNANEKLYTTFFPSCCPKTIVTSRTALLHEFAVEQQTIIVKPLHAMGGYGVFLLRHDSTDFVPTIESLTRNGKYPIMGQQYLPEISQGDKRVLMIDGQPYRYGLARLAAPGSIKANLAAGGTGIAYELSPHDKWITEQVGPTLKKEGLFFVGLDIIGDYLTEINVTSPTCVREIEALFHVNICAHILDQLMLKIADHKTSA